MKQRILTGWTFGRGVYLVLGLVIVIQSAWNGQWLGVLFGGYFASMGLFAFGCAAGNCFGGSCRVETKANANNNVKDVNFEEVK
ncbi:hypothetical protein [Pedobacter arcticus]|uniref:hypothetical protein n=1 Tax=Pedobacter arcticus TaxID=752140 RepID=UPI0002E72B0B|nr:hypothetical protein [Pedobacter arcticus]